MGLFYRAVRQAAITTGSTQDFTVSGLGSASEMKAARFIVTEATTDNTKVDTAMYAEGWTVGTSEFGVCIVAADDEDPSVAKNIGSKTNVLTILAPDGTIDGVAEFDSWANDGVVLNWTTLPSKAYLITCVLYGGSDLTASIAEIITSGVEDATVTHTIGLNADLCRTLCILNTFDDTIRANARLSAGWCSNSGSIKQNAVFVDYEDAATAANEIVGTIRDDRIMCSAESDPKLTASAEITAFPINQVTVATRNEAEENRILGIFFSFNGKADCDVDTYSTKTSTGSDAVTGVGFEPGYVEFGFTQTTAFDIAAINNRAGVFGVGLGTLEEAFSHGITNQFGQDPTISSSLVDDQLINILSAPGTTAMFTATLTSFDSDGYTLNASAVQFGIARVFQQVTIERPPVDIDVPTSDVEIVPFAPTIAQSAKVVTPSETVEVVPFVPAVAQSVRVAVPLATIAIAGFVPAVAQSVLVQVPLATVEVQDFTASVGQSVLVSVPSETVEVQGFAPTVAQSARVVVPLATVEVQGFVPSVAQSARVTAPLGLVEVVPFAPTVGVSTKVGVPFSTIEIVPAIPEVALGVRVASPLASVELEAFTPTVAQSVLVSVPLGLVEVVPAVPSVGQSAVVQTPLGLVEVVPFAPTIQIDAGVTVPVASVEIVPFVPTILKSVRVVSPLGVIDLTPFPVTVSADIIGPFEMFTRIIVKRMHEEFEDVEGVYVLYDNFPDRHPENECWVRFAVLPGETLRISNKRHRTVGIWKAVIHCPLHRGIVDGMSLADKIATVFRAAHVKPVVFKSPTPPRTGRAGPWWTVTVEGPWHSDFVQQS